MAAGAQTNPRHGWLAAVLPADVQRVRVVDESLARTLADAGADVVDARADVEIGPADDLRGDAAWAVVPLDAGDARRSARWEARHRLVRAARRVAGSAAVRVGAAAARRALVARGYVSPNVLMWDQERPVRLPSADRRRAGPGFFPLGAIVVGARRSNRTTLLERAVADAAREGQGALALDRLRTASWGILVLDERLVARVTVGTARGQLRTQAAELEHLRRVADSLDAFVPWPVATGRTGIADWLLEPRLAGEAAAGVPNDRLLDGALDVLASLHAAGRDAPPTASLADDADTLAAVLPSTAATEVRELGRALEQRLADVPRAFAHGDFSPANLLQRGGTLTGVVDWNKAGRGRLPLLDFLNLELTIDVIRSRRSPGDAFIEHLLPWARAGGSEAARAFCRRLGIEARERLFEDLAAAWWLDRHAHQLRSYSDRSQRPAWLAENVVRPLRALRPR